MSEGDPMIQAPPDSVLPNHAEIAEALGEGWTVCNPIWKECSAVEIREFESVTHTICYPGIWNGRRGLDFEELPYLNLRHSDGWRVKFEVPARLVASDTATTKAAVKAWLNLVRLNNQDGVGWPTYQEHVRWLDPEPKVEPAQDTWRCSKCGGAEVSLSRCRDAQGTPLCYACSTAKPLTLGDLQPGDVFQLEECEFAVLGDGYRGRFTCVHHGSGYGCGHSDHTGVRADTDHVASYMRSDRRVRLISHGSAGDIFKTLPEAERDNCATTTDERIRDEMRRTRQAVDGVWFNGGATSYPAVGGAGNVGAGCGGGGLASATASAWSGHDHGAAVMPGSGGSSRPLAPEECPPRLCASCNEPFGVYRREYADSARSLCGDCYGDWMERPLRDPQPLDARIAEARGPEPVQTGAWMTPTAEGEF